MAATELTVKPLDSETWPDFVRLVEKHNGVWGGCWCLAFHQKGTGSMEGKKNVKHGMVCERTPHAALVFGGKSISASEIVFVGQPVVNAGRSPTAYSFEDPLS